MPKVLIVDDDRRLLNMLRRTLAYEGLQVLTASDGYEALDQVQQQRPDVIILDWLMPGLDGIQVVRQLREANDKTWILMLTARDAIEDRVEGLESGADDYLVKPFAPAELTARVHALLRRAETVNQEQPLLYADLTLDPLTREVYRGERRLELTATEFALLHCFLQHPRQALTKAQLLEAVWGYASSGDENLVEVYIGYLRRKTEAGGEPRLIQTIRGVGYALREE
jgi:two-component system response regulator MprA